MSALSIQPTYPIFTETDGLPLENGYICIGAANLDPQGNPINVYWDDALTIPAGQPIRTLNGYPSRNGTPARLYVNSDYSIRVMNKNGSVVYSAPAATERYNGGVISTINAGQVEYDPSGTGAVATTVQTKLREYASVKDFGAVGDYNATTGTGTDDTVAIQAAMDYGLATGKRIFFPAGFYKITDTISLLNANFVRSFGFFGENGNSTRIYFDNATVLKNMFFVDTNVNYLEVSDLEFQDETRHTSRGFYFRDITPDPAGPSPSWKMLFRNVRVFGFKEGVRFDGATLIVNDAHCSEVMFLHSKIRNCETGLIYNNTQAVNHQLIGLDMENDDEGVGDAWTHIKLERGATINHIGGSVIGKGSYLSYTYSTAAGFADTSQFASKGVRVEMRGGTAPLINQDTASTVTVSNSLRVIIDDMPIVTGGATIFARFGGRTFAKFSNIHSNTPLDVEAYMTTNLSANREYGAIVMEKCQNLNYKRISTVTAYGSAGVAATNYRSIPAEISYQNEGLQSTVDGGGYTVLSNPAQSIYAGDWQLGQLKTLVFVNPTNLGFGSGTDPATDLITLPLYGRPCKFRLLRDDVNAGSAFVLDLYIVVSGVDHLVASITPTANQAGHFEANIVTVAGTPLINLINDGVNWDGKMKVVKSGTVNGYVGLIMIDYM